MKEFLRFSAFYRSFCDMNKSCVSYDDKVPFATAFMNKRTASHECEDVGSSFKFFKAWEVLRDLPKDSTT